MNCIESPVLCCAGAMRGGDGALVPGPVVRAAGRAYHHVRRGAGPARLHPPHGPRQRRPRQVPRLLVRLEPSHPRQGAHQELEKVGSSHSSLAI